MYTSEERLSLGAVSEAVTGADALTARRLLAPYPPGDGDVLDELARLAAGSATSGNAPSSQLAVELLLEQLDASGIVRRFVRAALLDESAIEDVTQDVLISVAGSISSFAGTSKVTTWVHRIVRNRVVDHLRRQRATSPLPPDDLGPAERMSSMIATRATVRDVLAGLPDLYREPVVLRDVQGLSYAELSEQLDRSVGTVKSQVSRGRALVAAALRDTAFADGASTS